MRFTPTDVVTISISVVALTFSVINFVIQQIDRNSRLNEDSPVLGFTYYSPGEKSKYGFFVQNRGSKRAHWKFVEFFTQNEKYAGQAADLRDALELTANEYDQFVPGKNFTMPPGSTVPLYVFNKKLDKRQQRIFEEYVTKLSANICYCDSSDRNCRIHIVALTQSVIDAGVRSNKSCGG